MNLTAFTNQLSRVLTKRLSKAIMSNNKREIVSIKKLLDDPQGLQTKVEDIQKRHQQGDTFDQPRIDKDIAKSFPDSDDQISGAQVVEGLKVMGTDQSQDGGKYAETSGFVPHTLKNIQSHDKFEPEFVDVDDIYKSAGAEDFREYLNNSKKPRENTVGTEPTVPPIIDNKGQVLDGYNRLHMAKLAKEDPTNPFDGKVQVLRGSSTLQDNVNNDVLNRIGSFAENLKKKIKGDKGDVKTKVGTNIGASLKNVANKPQKGSFIKSFAKATNNFDPEIVDDELFVGIAMDLLRVVKNNKGGRPGKKLTEIDSSGDTHVVTAKNMNELYKEVGEAVSNRILSRGGSPLKEWEEGFLGSVITEFGRGNFGGKYSETDLTIPHLFKESQQYKDIAKGEIKDQRIIVTSDYFNNWYKTTDTGGGGRHWFDLYPVNRSRKSASPIYQGPWVVDANGNVIKAPAGVDKSKRIGGGKGDTSQTKDDLKILNALGSQKMGVDPDKFEYWKHLGRMGVFKDSGVDKASLELAIAKSKLDEDDAGLLTTYYLDLNALKTKYNNLEDLERIANNELPLTPLERQNFGVGEHIRTSIYEGYYKKGVKTKEDKFPPPTGEKVELDNSVGGFESGNDAFLKALQTVSRDTSNIAEINTIKRAKFNRIEREINERFRMDPDGAEMYIPYILDSRTRVYPLDASGANLISGMGRFNYSATRAQAKPITYNDEAFYLLVDDLLRFETNPIVQTRVGSGETIGLASTAKVKSALSGNDSRSKELKNIILGGTGKGAATNLDRFKYWKLVENQYLERAENLLKVIDNSKAAKNSAERSKIWSKWKSKNSWLNNIKDQEPYMANLAEIGRIKRAYDLPSQLTNKNEPSLASLQNQYPELSNSHMTTHLGELDASASGSQVLGAQYGDLDLSTSVNIFSRQEGRAKGILTREEQDMILDGVDNNAIARDLYMEVKHEYSGAYEKDMIALKEVDPQRHQIYTELTDKYIQVGRSTTKPIVMKVPYGAGMPRLKMTMEALISGKDRIKIMRDYQGRVEDSTTLAKEFSDFHWDSMEPSLKNSLETQYEFRRFSSVVGKLYSELAGPSRKPYMVKSPTGGETDFTVYATQNFQTYESVSLNRLPSFKPKPRKKGGFNKDGTPIMGVGRTQVTTTSKVPMDPNDPRTKALVTPGKKSTDKARNKRLEKMGINPDTVEMFAVDGKMVQEFPFAGDGSKTMASALAPNAVHSLDAAYLRKLVFALQEAGIPVYVVHDAFFVLFPDMKQTKQIAGKVMLDMHNNYNLREEMLRGLAKATDTTFEDVLSKVDDIMANPTAQEQTRGILPYPDGSLRMKSEGPLTAPEGFTTENVILGG